MAGTHKASGADGKVPFDWQLEAARLAVDENVIVNVGTGLGKTLVAVLAMDDALRRQPDKKCAFIVGASRLLARQQWRRIRDECVAPPHQREASDDEVALATGYTTGRWKKKEWTDCIENCKVIVATAEVFRRAVVERGYLRFSDFSLIVADECHEARKESPLAGVFKALHREGRTSTRILGLTATFAARRCMTESEFVQERQDLESLMCARLHAPKIPEPDPPKIHTVHYEKDKPDPSIATAHQKLSERLCDFIWKQLEQHQVTHKDVTSFVKQLAVVLTEVGRDAFIYAVKHGIIAQTECKVDNYDKFQDTQALCAEMQDQLKLLRECLPGIFEQVEADKELCECKPYSKKVAVLTDLITKSFAANVDNAQYCGIVLVKEVAIAGPLAHVLRQQLGTRPKVAAVTGTQSMEEAKRNAALDSFEMGRSQLLVATECAEQGIDIPACAFVIRFSKFGTSKSHKQGAGRARQPHAMIFYFENDAALESVFSAQMDQVAASSKHGVPKEQLHQEAKAMAARGQWHAPGRHPYVIPTTHVEVNHQNAPNTFREYVDKTSRGKAKLQELFSPGDGSSMDDSLCVPGPGGGFRIAGYELQRFFDSDTPDQITSKALFVYTAVLVLHSRHWLTENNQATPEAIRDTTWPPTAPNEAPFFDFSARWCPTGLGSPEAVYGEEEETGGSGELDRRLDQGHSYTDSNGDATQQGESRMIPLSDVFHTQVTVYRNFSNGASVFQAMLDLASGKSSLAAFPLIRVAEGPAGTKWAGRYYAADNRRLFMAKVVGPTARFDAIPVQVVNWTQEFKFKLKQRPRLGGTWLTSERSIDVVRNKVQLALGKGGRMPQQKANQDEGLDAFGSAVLDNLLEAGIGGEEQGLSVDHSKDEAVTNRSKEVHGRAPCVPDDAPPGLALHDAISSTSSTTATDAAPGAPSDVAPAMHAQAVQLAESAAAAAVPVAAEPDAEPDLDSEADSVDKSTTASNPSREESSKVDDRSTTSDDEQLPRGNLPDTADLAVSGSGSEELQKEIWNKITDIVQANVGKFYVDPVGELQKAVDQITRPTNAIRKDRRHLCYFFRQENDGSGHFVCAASLCNRKFEGEPCSDKSKAKLSAAEAMMEGILTSAIDAHLEIELAKTSESKRGYEVDRHAKGMTLAPSAGFPSSSSSTLPSAVASALAVRGSVLSPDAPEFVSGSYEWAPGQTSRRGDLEAASYGDMDVTSSASSTTALPADHASVASASTVDHMYGMLEGDEQQSRALRPRKEQRPPADLGDQGWEALKRQLQKQQPVDDIRDPVSTLNQVVQSTLRPECGRKHPLEYVEESCQTGGFMCTVHLCTETIAGPMKQNKKLARMAAARKVIEKAQECEGLCDTTPSVSHSMPSLTRTSAQASSSQPTAYSGAHALVNAPEFTPGATEWGGAAVKPRRSYGAEGLSPVDAREGRPVDYGWQAGYPNQHMSGSSSMEGRKPGGSSSLHGTLDTMGPPPPAGPVQPPLVPRLGSVASSTGYTNDGGSVLSAAWPRSGQFDGPPPAAQHQAASGLLGNSRPGSSEATPVDSALVGYRAAVVTALQRPRGHAARCAAFESLVSGTSGEDTEHQVSNSGAGCAGGVNVNDPECWNILVRKYPLVAMRKDRQDCCPSAARSILNELGLNPLFEESGGPGAFYCKTTICEYHFKSEACQTKKMARHMCAKDVVRKLSQDAEPFMEAAMAGAKEAEEQRALAQQEQQRTVHLTS